MDQLLRKQHLLRLRHRHRRRPQVLQKQPPQLPLTQPQPLRQLLDAFAATIQRTFRNQRQPARNRIRRPPPRRHLRRRLRPASQAGPIARVLRRRRRAEKSAILKLRRSRRTNRPAIDSSRRDANVHQPVQPRLPALQSAITNLTVRQFHDYIFAPQKRQTRGFRTSSLQRPHPQSSRPDPEPCRRGSGGTPQWLLVVVCSPQLLGHLTPQRPHQRKQNHIPNRLSPRQNHSQPIDPNPLARRRRQPIPQRPHIVLIHRVSLIVPPLPLLKLRLKPPPLIIRIVQLRERIPNLKPANIKLKPLHPIRLIRLHLRKRRHRKREVINNRRLNEMRLSQQFKQISAIALPSVGLTPLNAVCVQEFESSLKRSLASERQNYRIRLARRSLPRPSVIQSGFLCQLPEQAS